MVDADVPEGAASYRFQDPQSVTPSGTGIVLSEAWRSELGKDD